MIAADGHAHAGGGDVGWLFAAIAVLVLTAYAAGMILSARRGRPWPRTRALCAVLGVAAAAAAVVGPLADAAHSGFAAHMQTHLLIGMVAPVLLVLSAPVTLALRTLSVDPARRLSRVLRSAPARFVSAPLTALVFSAGGLWVLYFTPLVSLMPSDPLVHLLVQAHLLVAGLLFASAVIGIDPRPHGPRWMLRAVVLALSMASHSILAKYLYAHPPTGVAVDDARAGAELMYYAGGWVEASVVLVFCLQWYRATARDGRGAVRAPVASEKRQVGAVRGNRWSSSTRSSWVRGSRVSPPPPS
ncbi:cytochrome c oxidase assembly protein [Microbacterium sp. 1P10UB]|uniref:cytochrome c oxidase assembly protein n=1 Tax=unclassified Microbacterium TaxID=2609290 RepID=UPI0039A3DE5C